MFFSPILGKGSIGSPVQYIGFLVHYWEMFSRIPIPCITGKRFYKIPSPILGKGSIGTPVQY